MSVRVRFDVREPERHLVHVTQRFPATPEGERTFRMAAWVPGSYKIRDFGRHVQDLTATVGGRKRAVRQTGKDAWMVTGTKDQEVELTFAVYGRELGVRSTHVTSDHAHLFPATLALYDEASRAQPHEVSCAAPRGWRLWSALHGSDDEGAAPATVGTAADYDELIDSPLELAPPSEVHVVSFTARRKRHRLVFYHPPGGVDWTRLTKDVRGVVEAAARLFGGLPYDHYTFITHVAAGHGGGLEHRASTVLGLDPAGLLTDYEKRFLPLVAHEFFHVWNVKRIQPSAFQPFDLQREVHTDLLWLFEGFTAYHEPVLLRRAGVIDDARFGELVAESLGFYEMAL
ncbi:MAG: M61 family peptidase, partial [Thermoplasmatota archaeon]